MHRTEESAAPWSVYDLDGVITRKDTFQALITKRLLDSPMRLACAVPAAIRWACARGADPAAAAARRICGIALRGLDEDSYATLAAGLGEAMGGDPTWIRTEIVERMRAQHERGVRIVVATATEERLARTLLERVGAPHDLLSASALGFEGGNVVFRDHRVGERKAEALLQLGVPLARAEFLTDSATDLPTALIASRTVLVGASARSRARFRSAGVETSGLPEQP